MKCLRKIYFIMKGYMQLFYFEGLYQQLKYIADTKPKKNYGILKRKL